MYLYQCICIAVGDAILKPSKPSPVVLWEVELLQQAFLFKKKYMAEPMKHISSITPRSFHERSERKQSKTFLMS